jgi:hypothetical protein
MQYSNWIGATKCSECITTQTQPKLHPQLVDKKNKRTISQRTFSRAIRENNLA